MLHEQYTGFLHIFFSTLIHHNIKKYDIPSFITNIAGIIVNKCVILELFLVDYRNSPMDLTDVTDRSSGDLSVLKAGLLPQVDY